MLVVSDTSPVTNLAAVGRLNLLKTLFTEILVPEEVRDELVLGGTGNNPGADEVRTAPWFIVSPVDTLQRDEITHAHRALDIGEAAALALAVARSADLILLDDKAARDAANALHLSCVGVVGILLLAKTRGLLPQVRPILDDLRSQAGFRLADAVYQEAIRLAGE